MDVSISREMAIVRGILAGELVVLEVVAVAAAAGDNWGAGTSPMVNVCPTRGAVETKLPETLLLLFPAFCPKTNSGGTFSPSVLASFAIFFLFSRSVSAAELLVRLRGDLGEAGGEVRVMEVMLVSTVNVELAGESGIAGYGFVPREVDLASVGTERRRRRRG